MHLREKILAYRRGFQNERYNMYRLLIVDDEVGIRNGLANFFPWAKLGFQVVGQARNGEQALRMIKEDEEPIDVVITDIKMPVMDGLKLIEQLKKCDFPGKIIFLSAYNEFEYARRGLQLGVYDYILKPTDYRKIAELFERLKKELDSDCGNEKYGAESLYDKTGFDYKGKIIKEVKEYVKKNYAEIKLADAAAHVNLSSSYLSVLFSAEAGMSFSEYVQMVRLQEAARLLAETYSKIYEISERVGYNNSKNFTRAFRKFYGMSPRDYRNKGQNRNEKE